MEADAPDGTRIERRTIDHVELEDGTFLLFDPRNSEAWIECRTPIYLPGRA